VPSGCREISTAVICSFQLGISHLLVYYCYHRHFILKLVAENTPFHHAIMNLPQNATDFLDVFIGLHTRLGPDRYVSGIVDGWV
jgi:hypothetical protein